MSKILKSIPNDILTACVELASYYEKLQLAIERQNTKEVYNISIELNKASGVIMSRGWHALYGPTNE